MKITAFNPLILTKDAQSVKELFEAMGFEHRHTKTGINDQDITSYDMKLPEGFRVDVTQVPMPQDMTVIRMNVRDFDEAYQFLLDRGFKNAQGDKVTDTGSSKATLMVSPTGFAISLAEHIRKE
ncbi:MAG: hypothetical protein IKP95_03600 [Ruminococcus sp.]|nr:hypothetical protein [Ruminococcus sp.]